jgi:hypothetical protein
MDIFVVALLLGAGSVAWLFYKKSSRVAPISNQPPLRLQGNGTYEFAVLGVSHYRPALEKLCDVDQRDPKTVEAVLVPEDTNARDKNAVRVEIQGRTVGYLPPDLSEAYRKRLAESGYPGARSICKAQLIVRMHSSMGGHADYSVRLDLPRRRSGK